MLRALALLVFISGCSSTPVLMQVDKTQDYTVPSKVVMLGTKVTWKEAIEKCGKGTLGCTVKIVDNVYQLYYTGPEVLVHECEHIAHGTEHH